MEHTDDLARPSSLAVTAKSLSRRQAYTLVGTFAFGWVLFFPGMQAINPLLPSVRAEFGLSGAQMGLITSLFILPYLLMQIPGGVLADRIGARRALLGMLLLAGICLTAVGLWRFELLPFVAIMMLYWTSCSVYYSATFSTTMAVVPPRQRGVASSLLTTGTALGAAVGFAAAVPLSDLAGGNWRFALLVFGLATLAVPIMLLLPRWPGRQRSVASFGGLAAIFHDRVLITLLVINLATSYTSSVLTVWGPSFLGLERGLSPVDAGLYLAMVNLIGIPATSLGGILSDRISRHYLTLFLFLAAGLSIAALALFAAPPLVLGAIVAYGLFGKWTSDAPLGAFLGDHLAARYPTMGSAISGVNNTARMTGALLAPAVTGLLLDQTGTLASGLLLGAAVLLAAGLLVLLVPR